MIDRDIDLISPFCVGQTFEALLDQFYRIITCKIKVDSKIVYPDEKEREEKCGKNPKKLFKLTSEDNFFHGVRNKHFNSVKDAT